MKLFLSKNNRAQCPQRWGSWHTGCDHRRLRWPSCGCGGRPLAREQSVLVGTRGEAVNTWEALQVGPNPSHSSPSACYVSQQPCRGWGASCHPLLSDDKMGPREETEQTAGSLGLCVKLPSARDPVVLGSPCSSLRNALCRGDESQAAWAPKGVPAAMGTGTLVGCHLLSYVTEPTLLPEGGAVIAPTHSGPAEAQRGDAALWVASTCPMTYWLIS